jgi:hypothetical protein
MSISDSKKIDILWKKLFYVAADTDPGNKDGTNETTTRGIILLKSQMWNDSNFIPATPPRVDTPPVGVKIGDYAIRLKRDDTVVGNRSWYAIDSYGNRIINWIPPSMGQDYQVRVYVGTVAYGVTLNPLLTNNEWIFDYSSGTLTFVNCVPLSVLDMGVSAPDNLFLEGYTYTGAIGDLGGVVEYEISGTVFGVATPGDILMKFIIATPLTFSKNLLTSQARCAIRPTKFTSFGLFKNGVQFGTMTFAPASNFGTFKNPKTLFSSGDELLVIAQNTDDLTFGNAGWTIVATQTVE